jgi:hypothetical protein
VKVGRLVGGGGRLSLGLGLAALTVACAATAASPPLARAAGSSAFFGVVPATSTSDAELGRLADGGAGVVRFALDWRSVQPFPNGPYRWGAVDEFVLDATRRGIAPLPNLGARPPTRPTIAPAPRSTAARRGVAGSSS